MPKPDTIDLQNDILRFQDGDAVEVITTGTLPSGIAADTDYFVIIDREWKSDTAALRIRLAATLDDALDETAIDITDAGSGTHTVRKVGEPRYHCAGIADTKTEVGETLDNMRSAMAGRLIWFQGRWVLSAAAWRPPRVCIEDKDLAPGKITIRSNRPSRGRFNAVQGRFSSPMQLGEPSDYPPVVSATFESADGSRKFNTLDLPFTSRASTARRIAKIDLHRHRREIQTERTLNAAGLIVHVNDTVAIDDARRGWEQKTFEVENRELTTLETGDGDGLRALAVNLTLSEIDANAFTFDPVADDVDYQPAPRTTHTNPLTALPPLGLSVGTAEKTLGVPGNSVVVYYAALTWQAPNDKAVTEGGEYLPEWRDAGEDEWNPAPTVNGRETRVQIGPLVKGNYYDFRVRSVSWLGPISKAAAALYSYRIGDAVGGASSIWDLGRSVETVSTFTDLGASTDAVTSVRDLAAD